MLDQAPPFAKKPMPGATDQAVEEDIDAIQEDQASPEEQEQYNVLMKLAYEIMAREKPFDLLTKMIEQDPLQALADATLSIIDTIEKEQGQQDPDMLQALAEEIIPNLAELAEELGHDIPEDQLEQVATTAITQWMKANPDRVDQDAVDAISSVASPVLQQASQDGAIPQAGQGAQVAQGAPNV